MQIFNGSDDTRVNPEGIVLKRDKSVDMSVNTLTVTAVIFSPVFRLFLARASNLYSYVGISITKSSKDFSWRIQGDKRWLSLIFMYLV